MSLMFDPQTLEAIAEMICGDDERPKYRSGRDLTAFFRSAGLPQLRHDGSTRKHWTLNELSALSGPEIKKVVLRLADPKEYRGDKASTSIAHDRLNSILAVEGLSLELSGVKPVLVQVSAVLYEGAEADLAPAPPPEFGRLKIQNGLDAVLSARWQEANRCVNSGAHLAAVVMMGSLLEGMLLATMEHMPREANSQPSTPRDNHAKPKAFHRWSLSEMINVAHDAGWLDLDVKRFSHALREFRNLIHPYQQWLSKTTPDEHTCAISWSVVTAAIADLATVLK